MEIPHSSEYGVTDSFLTPDDDGLSFFTPEECEIISSTPDWYLEKLSIWSTMTKGPWRMDQWSIDDLRDMKNDPGRFDILRYLIENCAPAEEISSTIQRKFEEQGYKSERASELVKTYLERKAKKLSKFDKRSEESEQKIDTGRKIRESIIKAGE